MDSLVDQVAALFEVADAELAEEFVAMLTRYDDGVLDLELPLLRRLGAGAPAPLVSDGIRRLEPLVDAEPRAADDWSIPWSGCGCDLCGTLGRLLSSASATELDWPLRKDRRQHIHRCIDDAELPVTHRTVRKGRPFTLHLAKQRDLHRREAERRSRLAADLAWLRGW
ncbi:hypothetical protein [Gordonia iterans]